MEKILGSLAQQAPGSNGLSAYQLLLREEWWPSHGACDTVRAKESCCFRLNSTAHSFKRLHPFYNFWDSALEGQQHSPVEVFWVVMTPISHYSYQLPFVIVTESLWVGFVMCLPDNVIFGTFSIHIQTWGKVSRKMEKMMIPVIPVLFLSTPHGGKSLSCCGIVFLGFHMFGK